VAERGTVRMTLAEVGQAAGYSRSLAAAPLRQQGRAGACAGRLHRRAFRRTACSAARRWRRGWRPSPGNIHFYFARRGGAWTATRALLVMMTEACMAPNAALRHARWRPTTAAHWPGSSSTSAPASTRGEIDAGNDPAVTAVILLGAMRGVMLQWLVDPAVPVTRVRDRLLQVVQQVLQLADRLG
jgi:hypothetical protein